MKTLNIKFKMRNSFIHFILTGILYLISIQQIRSQDKLRQDHDYLMPGKRKSMVLLNSGIPYVAIGEYSYGFSNRFSLGIIYGYTPIVLGYGLRIKSVIAQPSENTRVYFKIPLIYYPKTKNLGGDPWVLAWPALNVEWKLHNGTRIWTGAGVIGASCVDALLGFEEDAEQKPATTGTTPSMKKNGVMSDLWNTFQFGFSKPLSNKMSWMAEVAPIFNGLKLAGEDWIAGPPLIVTLGVSYSL
jgi:hypothetical protein